MSVKHSLVPTIPEPSIVTGVTREQSIIYNLSLGCDPYEVAETHDVSHRHVQNVWLEHFQSMMGMKAARWFGLAEMIGAAVEVKFREILDDHKAFERLSLESMMRMAQKASEIGDKSAKLSIEIQRLPTGTGAEEFTPLQRDIYHEVKEILSEEEIKDRAAQLGGIYRDLCVRHKVSWKRGQINAYKKEIK